MKTLMQIGFAALALAANAVFMPFGPAPRGWVDWLLISALVGFRLGLRRLVFGCALLVFIAGLGLPRGCPPRTLAYGAAIRSDLKNLASQEEIFFSDYERYSASSEEIGFVASMGVRVSLVASEDGWSASLQHEALEADQGCVMYFGDAPTPTIDGVTPSMPGELVCALPKRR